MPLPRRKVAVLVAALLTSLSALTHAFGTNQNQPIHVASDHAELDDQKGISTYTGDVIVTQGLARLQADQVVIHSSDQGITKIIATGDQAHYEEQENESAPKTHAYADTIIYTESNSTIELIKNARLEQNTNSFQGDVIEYDTVRRRVEASASKESGKSGRVEMIFHPKQEGSSNSGSAN